MKTEVVRLRIPAEDKEALDKACKREGISLSALLRTFYREGLSSYDAKHQLLLGQIDVLNRKADLILEMSTVGAVLSAAGKELNFVKVGPHIQGAKELVKDAQEVVIKKTKKG